MSEGHDSYARTERLQALMEDPPKAGDRIGRTLVKGRAIVEVTVDKGHDLGGDKVKTLVIAEDLDEPGIHWAVAPEAWELAASGTRSPGWPKYREDYPYFARKALAGTTWPIPGSSWTHYKGGTYRYDFTAVRPEDNSLVACYWSPETRIRWARPLEEFLGKVDVPFDRNPYIVVSVPRFFMPAEIDVEFVTLPEAPPVPWCPEPGTKYRESCGGEVEVVAVTEGTKARPHLVVYRIESGKVRSIPVGEWHTLSNQGGKAVRRFTPIPS